jgi:FMN phosphatase YigB (HAD superfamily)
MALTLLFDLDDTLLDTHLEAFVPAYFRALTQCLEDRVLPTVMLRALVRGTSLMNESADPTHTLQEVFERNFYASLGVPKAELAADLEKFYDEVFPSLAMHTHPRPEATSLIQWAVERGYQIAIATDPLFPRKATAHRLRWAGFDPEQFELVSSYEDFHFTKAYPAYYAEMLGKLGWPEGPVLMVGNDIGRDLTPAHQLGIKTFFVDGEASSSPGFEAGRGRLGDLRPWLESIDTSTLEPSYKSRTGILEIMLSTPAVLQSLTRALTEEQCRHAPRREDWAVNEILCHLRDTEIEIHQLQLDLMLEKPDAFIPRPETAVWASEREYLHEDGALALRDFTAARLANLAKLRTLTDEVWSRRVRHAIFGPTNFVEVLGFMADHDQMHVQQTWKALKGL